MKNCKVRDLMTSPVITCESTYTVKAVAKLMNENKVSFIPIIKDGFIGGVVSEKEIVRRGICEEKMNCTVEEIMNTDEVICVRADETAVSAARIMAQFRVNRLLVTYNGQIRGLITAKHLLKSGCMVDTFVESMNRPKVIPCYLKFANFNSDDAVRIDDYRL